MSPLDQVREFIRMRHYSIQCISEHPSICRAGLAARRETMGVRDAPVRDAPTEGSCLPECISWTPRNDGRPRCLSRIVTARRRSIPRSFLDSSPKGTKVDAQTPNVLSYVGSPSFPTTDERSHRAHMSHQFRANLRQYAFHMDCAKAERMHFDA
jgi:hypothetical protein